MRTKYPSTPHLPWSPGLQNDDRRIETLRGLLGQEVVVVTPAQPRFTEDGRDLSLKLISEAYARKETGEELS